MLYHVCVMYFNMHYLIQSLSQTARELLLLFYFIVVKIEIEKRQLMCPKSHRELELKSEAK